ncbi:uncharacterized protein LOC134227632 [Armigeres subalbatus]|uniref:uncharacterized protein LOC134227632 n=1 Tax=Armigeres subalbatus TaxID=124917 RepID=UPI002ED53FC6
MCCCCVTVSLNLLSNLVQRIIDYIMELIYCQRRHCPTSSTSSVQSAEDQYHCQQSSNGDDPQQPEQHWREQDAAQRETKGTDPPEAMASMMMTGSGLYNVIYDTVELEPYFWAVDRPKSEEMLRGSPVGSCLVRPFKTQHPHIRYILSVHAAGVYFHLFIRLTAPNRMYALGLVKRKERQFKFPSDIVQYYQTHRLECSSSAAGAKFRLHLLPIVNSDNRSEGCLETRCEGGVITQQQTKSLRN